MQKMKKTIEGSGSDLFICFSSRPSAASASAATTTTVRVPSSKSLMSPNRSGGSNPSIPSLSSSLSRRLRSSGSIKGGQSPMFPAAGGAIGRKKGVAFEAAEPSSPKVTCIGQVRVKSKKKKNKNKNAVTRTRSGREASFRRREAGGGRKAVSICDALRTFGSEMNCFVPCGWSLCSPGEGEQEQRKRKKMSSSSCGAVFARWLMAIEEEGEEAEKGRELMGLVEEERGKGEVGVFVRKKDTELEVEEFFERRKEEIFERKGEVVVVEKEVEEEEDEAAAAESGRVSVCIPPTNALLLMRCRSDPVRMAALANRFWDSPAMKVQCEEREEDEEEEVGNMESEKVIESKIEVEEEAEVGEDHVEQASFDIQEVEKALILDVKKVEALEEEKIIVAEEAHEEVEKEVQVLNLPKEEEEEEEEAEILGEVISAEEAALEEEEIEGSKAISELIEKETKEEEALSVRRGEDEGEEVEIILRRSISCSATKSNELAKAKEGAKGRSFSYYREKKEKRRHSFSTELEARRQSVSVDKDGRRRWSFSTEKENLGQKEKPIIVQSSKQTKKEELPASAKEKPVKAVEPKITEKTQAAAVAADEVREKIQVSSRKKES